MAKVRALSDLVGRLARRSAEPVGLKDLYNFGRADAQGRLRFARFLHKEIAVRNAQIVWELHHLPWDLGRTQGVSKIIDVFSSYVDRLADFPPPRTTEDDAEFTSLLAEILEDHTQVVATLGHGVLDVRNQLGADAYENIRSEMTLILDRFFLKRIGIRFLLQHYLEAANARPGVSGIIHTNVAVGPILRNSASEAQRLCQQKYGHAPEVEVLGDGKAEAANVHGFGNSLHDMDLSHNRPFTYVPIHLQFSCSVLLQNACYAVAEKYAREGGEMQPVRAIFAHGKEEVSIKISDEGGGVSQMEIPYVWDYFDTAGGTDRELGRGRRHSTPLGPQNVNYPGGVGLPLARLHARYYGGELTLKPIQGFGTDAHLVLNRLGEECERLPHGVRLSPSMADSSHRDVQNIGFEALGDLTKAEDTHLRKKLKEFRRLRRNQQAQLDSSITPPL